MIKSIFWTLSVMMILAFASFSHADHGESGAVYVMTNSATANEIMVFNHTGQGVLSEPEAFFTQGLGSGGVTVDPLGSQGSLILSLDKRWLFAVNAGSNEISVFRVRKLGGFNGQTI